MRHRKKFNHLGRKSGHRKAMLANLASSLILNKRITTTTAKAKELRGFVEPLITRSRQDSTHSRRIVFRSLRDKDAVSVLFRDVAVKVGERPGGYTRIIKLEPRQGDDADVCMIELVDYNENLLGEKAARSKPSRRRRGSRKKQEEGTITEERVETTETAETPSGEVKEEEPAAEAKEETPSGEVKEEEPAAEPEEEKPAEPAEEPAAETDGKKPSAEDKEPEEDQDK